MKEPIVDFHAGDDAYVEVTQAQYDALLQQAQSGYPLETCGLLAGHRNQVRRLYPVTNTRQSPIEYEMDPVEQLAAFLDMEEEGWDLIAIYHSHPHGPQTPSASDVAQAYYPETAYVIVSLMDRHHPSIRAFNIVAGHVTEIPLQIV
jgi:proteasome lid subunit RPN8/RPN11